jgi:WG repeat protein/DnaJ-like protein
MADQLQQYYTMLEVSSAATAAEIRQSYLDLVKVWHPDRFQGESPRLRFKAEDKLKAINQAYEALRSGAPVFQAPGPPSGRQESPATDPGLKPIHFGGVWGYVNKDGKLVIEPRFDDAYPFQEGLALVSDHGRYGYIDATGNYAVYPEFSCGRGYSEGMAAVILSVHWGFVDREGRFAVTPLYLECGDFSEGLAPVNWRGRWGFIDREGRFVIRPRFDGARSFREGRAEVRYGEKWGEVDRSGQVYFAGGEILLQTMPHGGEAGGSG